MSPPWLTPGHGPTPALLPTGKGGATIAELQQSSNTRIQLSQATEHFPGTSDRMLLTSGGISDVLTALHLMFAKLNADITAQRVAAGGGHDNEAEETLPLRMVVPSAACGGIIGKGGSNIRHMIEDSGAGITLSHQVPRCAPSPTASAPN